MSYIFLSHSTKDKAFVVEFDNALESLGFKTFRDDKCISYGSSIPQNIFNNIEKSDFFLCFISEHFKYSKWMRNELDAAQMRHKTICPILISDVELPISLKALRAAKFINGKFEQEEFNHLVSKSLLKANTEQLSPPYNLDEEEGVNYMKMGLYIEAIRSFEKVRTFENSYQIDLYILCCELSEKNLLTTTHKEIVKFTKVLTHERFNTNKLATLVLAILYFEYYKTKLMNPIGFTKSNLLTRLEKLTSDEKNRFEIQGLKLSRYTSLTLGIKQ